MSENLNQRALTILGGVIKEYIRTGAPIGSKFLTQSLAEELSSATIRNVLAHLQKSGFLQSPHTSAGRLPTDEGLRYFVSALLEQEELTDVQQNSIKERCLAVGCNLSRLLHRVTEVLADLSGSVSFLLIPSNERIIERIECVALERHKTVLMIVADKGYVETRIVWLPDYLPFEVFARTVAIVDKKFQGMCIGDLIKDLAKMCTPQGGDVVGCAQQIVAQVLCEWLAAEQTTDLIVQGGTSVEQRDVVWSALEMPAAWSSMLSVAESEGVHTFIGRSDMPFSREDVSFVLSGFREAKSGSRIGVLGVAGSRRLDYGRILPLVCYMNRILTGILNASDRGFWHEG